MSKRKLKPELNRELKWTKDLFSGGGMVSISRLAGENLFSQKRLSGFKVSSLVATDKTGQPQRFAPLHQAPNAVISTIDRRYFNHISTIIYG